MRRKATLRRASGNPKPSASAELLKYRRAPSLVLYWQNNQLLFENYALQTRISADPLTCSILHFCGVWRSFQEICAFLNQFSESSILKSLNLLGEGHVLDTSEAAPDPRQKAIETWASWNPAAGFFHFSTKDMPFPSDPKTDLQQFVRMKREPMPLPVKNYPKAHKTKLPQAHTTGEFPRVLKSRRTWRLYGRDAVPLETLAEILQLTFGIHGWVDVPGLGRAAMKTSPSCGCLHPMEAYVLAQRVHGLKSGIYHYNAARHQLEWLREGVSGKALERNLGNQWWFTKAAFLVLMTAVFGRTRWKYEFPRVYRGILLEAGHLCQTFCLTATWRGLAPFCTIAYADTQWEKWLGIDGVNESLLYIAGAGMPPADVEGAHLGEL